MSDAHDAAVHKAVQAMINEIGQLRMLVAIDSMPHKLQQVRQLLRELDNEYERRSCCAAPADKPLHDKRLTNR